MIRRLLGGTLAVQFGLVALLVGVLGVLEVGPAAAAPDRRMTPEVWAKLLDRSLPVRDDGSSGLQRGRLNREKAPNRLNAILLMCDFSDSLMLGRYGEVSGDFPPPMQRERYYAAHDSLYFDHLLSYVADYFFTVSDGRFDFRFTINPETVNLPEPMSFYGDHPEQGEQKVLLAAEVIGRLDDDIAFEDYDTILIVHAGAGEETDVLGNSPEQIYSTFLSPEDFRQAVEDEILDVPYIVHDGAPEGEGIDQVLVLPETEYQDRIGDTWDGHFGSLGVYCFEVGLRLGMLSLSDLTPSGRPDSQGIGQYGLMGYGLYTGIGMIPPHPCPLNKLLMGWVDPVPLDPLAGGTHELEHWLGDGGGTRVYRVDATGQEYWLLEYRLQDPDGNRAFSFPDDKNGNHVYDFWDASTEDHRPVVGEFFDADFDSLERPRGSEWDFAMSENNARVLGELGFGSGVYVWHIDEGVIRDTFDSPTNLFNADPLHKAVDLEEADGIQDLDSAIPTSYWLGSDDDSFRADGNTIFGPDTRPSTGTSFGARTGIVFSDFGEVFVGLTDDTLYVDDTVTPPLVLTGIEYAKTTTFDLASEFGSAVGPAVAVRRELPPGTDLRGSHLLVVDLDAGPQDGCSPEGPAEIVAASRTGEVYVLDADLQDYLDLDGDAGQVSAFATGTRDGEPVRWNLPAAAGDIDGDGAPEIVLSSGSGVFAFDPDGSSVASPLLGSTGLYADVSGCELPPVLVPADWDGEYCAFEEALVCIVAVEAGASRLEFYGGPEGDLIDSLELGAGRVAAPPVFADGRIFTAVDDTVAGTARLMLSRNGDLLPIAPQGVSSVDLGIRPGPFPISIAWAEPDLAEDSQIAVHVPGRDGQTVTVLFEPGYLAVAETFLWKRDLVPLSPLAPGGAFVGAGLLGRAGHYGHWLDGWPRLPRESIEASPDSCAGSPLVATIPDSDLPLRQYLFPVRDGRIFGLGTQGESAPYWPVGGPARSAGTPATGPIIGAGSGDLVAAGTFRRITGLDGAAAELEGADVSMIYLWQDVLGADALWPMWGGSPWRNGSYDRNASIAPPFVAAGTGLVPGSLSCYPNPLVSGPLYVRGSMRSPGRARAYIYNLEGEEVVRTEWEPVSTADPFSLEVDIAQAATGLYLCRLEVADEAGGVESSVIQFAVVH